MWDLFNCCVAGVFPGGDCDNDYTCACALDSPLQVDGHCGLGPQPRPKLPSRGLQRRVRPRQEGEEQPLFVGMVYIAFETRDVTESRRGVAWMGTPTNPSHYRATHILTS